MTIQDNIQLETSNQQSYSETKLCRKESKIGHSTDLGTDYSFKHEIVWFNVVLFMVLHMLALWGLVILITGGVCFKTYLWIFCIAIAAGEGITIGAHRFFTHKCFKAKPALKMVLLALQTMAGENSLFVWARDHRLHHRYTDTDADPHNSKRGFFFSHMGWLMMKKHPYVIEFGKKIDMSDLKADWMVMLQYKYFYYLYFLIGVFIPVWVPMHYFGETFWNSFMTCYAFRYLSILHVTWLVNSAAHLYGTRPYDKNLQPVESWFVSMITLGEGWHNYHHAFPWDYKAAELTKLFNFSARLIEFCETLGLAYDLKKAPAEMVRNRIIKVGDGTHYDLGNEESKRAVTAFGPLHPLNPSYNVTYHPPNIIIKNRLSLLNRFNIMQHETEKKSR